MNNEALRQRAGKREREVVVEDLLALFASWTLYYDANTADYYHPGRSARAVMDGATVAQLAPR